MITKQYFKRFLAVLAFVTGCFLRTLPVFALIAFMIVYGLSYFVQWCYGWLSYIFTASERCMPNDIYNTKLTEYFLVIVYFACFFAMMYFTNPKRKKHPRKPAIQGDLFNEYK
jgi:uncharacterized membrane protein HdeD (DUF308 family)